MLKKLINKVYNNEPLTKDDALQLSIYDNLDELYAASHQITIDFASHSFDMCSIINSKSGNCKSDCKWCAQSSHSKTKIETYPLIDAKTCLEHAQYNEKKGVHRFSLVNSGVKPNNKEIDDLTKIFNYISLNSKISLCASLGLATKEQLEKLYKAGVKRYHCNLETSAKYFGKLCTTHTQEDKINTIKAAKAVGMDICSGGIIGMGESFEDRIDMAITLRDLEINSIPINVLHPIKGTPLENLPLLSEEQILKTIAIYRFILPKAYLRMAGGRILLEKNTFKKALYVGINSAIVGDLLTTIGSKIDDDIKTIKNANYTLDPLKR